MAKIAIIVLADTESHADLGRVTNALQTAKEGKEAGDEVQVILDGAGTQWIERFLDETDPIHDRYTAVADVITGVCDYCADAFDVDESLAASDVDALSDYEGHPSIRSLVADGYEVITF